MSNDPTALTPQQLLAARAIDVLASLSGANIDALRRERRPNDTGTMLIPRETLRGLLQALEDAYPGALDATLGRIADQGNAR